MADISRELQAIMSAIYGEEVRGSIHDAIELINLVAEATLSCGTDVTSQSSSITGYYEGSIYINTTTDDMWECDGSKWVRKGNLEGNSITGITKIDTDVLVDTYRITFSKASPITFTVTNGKGITSITKTDTQDLVDIYTIAYNDGTSATFTVTNGYSPTISAVKVGKVTTITVTNQSGSTSEQVLDGYDPTVEVSKTGSVATITITDINGPHTVQIHDGESGSGTGDMLKSVYDQNDDGIIDEVALPIATNAQIETAIDAVR